MRPRSTALRTLGAIIGVGLLAFAWVNFGPTQLAGPATYALIQGNSMEPQLYQGDLAVIRSKSGYEVGDVVAYHSSQLDRLVLHRIVDRDGAEFVLQGDNNDFIDSAQPSTDQIVGELSLKIPKAGALVGRLRGPVGIVILLGLAGFVLRAGRGSGRRAFGRKKPAGEAGDTETIDATLTQTQGRGTRRAIPQHHLQTLLGIAGGAVVVLALVAAVAHSRPTVETAVVPDLYQQSGTFSYSADVSESPAYDSLTASDGDAIFTSLANIVDFTFDYAFSSDDPHTVAGTAALYAKLTDGEGLERTFRLSEPQEFGSDRATVSGWLSLAKLQRLILQIQEATGAVSSRYFVTVLPQVDVSGTVGETAITDEFSPSLVFSLDPTRLALSDTSALDDSANALERTQMGSGHREATATFDVLGFTPTVATSRRVGLLGALIALAVLVAAFVLARVCSSRGAASDGRPVIRATSGARSDKSSIELATYDDLVRVADMRDQLVVQIDAHDGTTYVVDDTSVQYRYSTGPNLNAPEQPAPAPEPTTAERSTSDATEPDDTPTKPGDEQPADTDDLFSESDLANWLRAADCLARDTTPSKQHANKDAK